MSEGLGLGNPSSAFGSRGVRKRIDAVASHRAAAGEHLLDVGCGDGTYTVEFAQGFRRTDAIDIEPSRLEMFRERLAGSDLDRRVTVRRMAAENLAFPDATFDRVTAFEVVEHVEGLRDALVEVHRVLRPGGAFSLTTPNRWFPFETHGVLWGTRRRSPITAPLLPWVPPLHRRMSDARVFTAKRMRGLLASAGLDMQQLDYLMPPFDRRATALQRAADALERTPLNVFGMAMAVTATKPERSA